VHGIEDVARLYEDISQIYHKNSADRIFFDNAANFFRKL
jgi:hypothetical protein